MNYNIAIKFTSDNGPVITKMFPLNETHENAVKVVDALTTTLKNMLRKNSAMNYLC